MATIDVICRSTCRAHQIGDLSPGQIKTRQLVLIRQAQKRPDPRLDTPGGGYVEGRRIQNGLLSPDPVTRLNPFRTGKTGVMWVEQSQSWSAVQLPIGHHLINIRLTHTLLGVIDFRRDAFPLRIDYMNDLSIGPYQDIWLGLEKLPTRLDVREAVSQTTLQGYLKSRPARGTHNQPPHKRLEQKIHLKHQRESAVRSATGSLKLTLQEHSRQPEQLSPALVCPIQDNVVPPQRRHMHVANLGVAEGEFAQVSLVLGVVRDACQPCHSRSHDAVQRDVLRQNVKTACQARRIDSISGELTDDIKPAPKRREVILMSNVLAGHSVAQRVSKLLAENPDEYLKQGFPLPIELSDPTYVDLQVQRDRKHVNQSSAYCAVLRPFPRFCDNIDLGQNLQTAAVRRQDTYNTPCPKSSASVFQNPVTTSPGKDRGFGHSGQAISCALRNCGGVARIRAVWELSPFQ